MHEKEISLLDYWLILWRRKGLLLSLFLVATMLTMVVSFALPKYYRSQVVVLALAPEPGGLGAMLSASPLAGAFTESLGGLSSPADKILVLLKSRTVAEMVIKRFDLLRVFNEEKWDPAKGAWKDPAKPPLMEDVVRLLGTGVTTFKKSKEGTITITVEWKDPKLAAQIANYYVVALADFMKDKSVNTTVQIVDPAVPAERKSSPKTGKNMITAGMISLLVGIVVAIVLERLSPRPR